MIGGCAMTTVLFLGLAGFLLSLLGGMSKQYDFDDDNDDWLDDNDNNQLSW